MDKRFADKKDKEDKFISRKALILSYPFLSFLILLILLILYLLKCERQRQQKRQGIGDSLRHLNTLKTYEKRQNHDGRDEENALASHR